MVKRLWFFNFVVLIIFLFGVFLMSLYFFYLVVILNEDIVFCIIKYIIIEII